MYMNVCASIVILTVNFISHNETRDLRSVLTKFLIPMSQILIGQFSTTIKYLVTIQVITKRLNVLTTH